MIDVRDVHRQAMEKAQQADTAQKAGDLEAARALFREAGRLESEAAHALIDEFGAEPTRSVLFRSAASLAIEAHQFAHAAYLVACGLEGFPPEEIREELRAVLRTVCSDVEQDRVGRFLSSCAYLQHATDRVRKALADRELTGPQLSGSVIQHVVGSTQDVLRAFTGDTSLSVGLVGIGDSEVSKWVSVWPVESASEWPFQFPKLFLLDHGDRLLKANPIVAKINHLASQRLLSQECFALAQREGVRALAAYPVRAIDENQADRPAFVLLALALQETAFADDLACQILLQTVSLLEIAVQVGKRDEALHRSQEESE